MKKYDLENLAQNECLWLEYRVKKNVNVNLCPSDCLSMPLALRLLGGLSMSFRYAHLTARLELQRARNFNRSLLYPLPPA